MSHELSETFSNATGTKWWNESTVKPIRRLGGVDGQMVWDTKEEAIVNFAMQLSEMAHAAQRHFLFVRRAPELVQANQFEGGTKWRMIGRFSIAKLKGKK